MDAEKFIYDASTEEPVHAHEITKQQQTEHKILVASILLAVFIIVVAIVLIALTSLLGPEGTEEVRGVDDYIDIGAIMREAAEVLKGKK